MAKKGITVTAVDAENFHRLKFAHARMVPGEGLVRVTGRNGSGKTSLLRAIRAALGGAGEVLPESVVHEGAEGGSVRIELSNAFTITRKFTAAQPKGYLTVIGPDGGQHKQAKLDEWLGSLSFDPLAFFELKPERQREILLSLGGDAELPKKLDGLRKARAAKYDERTPWIAKKRQAAQVTRPAGERPQPVDTRAEMARMGELQAVERQRSDQVREYERAQHDAAQAAERETERLAQADHDARTALRAATVEVARARDGVAELEAKLARAREWLESATASEAEFTKAATEAERRLAAAPDPRELAEAVPAPQLPDDPSAEMEAVRARIQDADAVRRSIEPWERWERAVAEQAEAAKSVEEITAAMDALEQQEKGLIAGAGIPVEGLGFSAEGAPVLNGRPLTVASGAERIRLAVAVALAANPDLRICLVDEANDIDLEGLAELDTLAKEHGFQVWAARLGIEGPGEIVVVDGEARARDEEPVEASA